MGDIESLGFPVMVTTKVAVTDLPRGTIVIEWEYTISRATKRYLGVPAHELPDVKPPPGSKPARVYHGSADIVEFVPSTHRALVWEVKKATLRGREVGAKAARIDAEHYVSRFNVVETRAGYTARLGTKFDGVENAPPKVYDVRSAGLGAVTYKVRERKRKPQPARPPVPETDPRLWWDAVGLVFVALALHLGGKGGRGGQGEPAFSQSQRIRIPRLVIPSLANPAPAEGSSGPGL